jgi:hypothetical protein
LDTRGAMRIPVGLRFSVPMVVDCYDLRLGRSVHTDLLIEQIPIQTSNADALEVRGDKVLDAGSRHLFWRLLNIGVKKGKVFCLVSQITGPPID